MTPTETRRRPLSALLRIVLEPAVWLERARGRKRLVLVFAYLLVLAAVVALTVRATSLNGLPDVGDPFDVAAFTADLPAGQDAFDLYRQAHEALRPLLGKTPETQKVLDNPDWRRAGPELRRWLEQNRAALDLWREGAERPGASYGGRRNPKAPSGSTVYGATLRRDDGITSFAQLALLEGSRREAEGRVEEAWGWYRAVLRCGLHLATRGTFFERFDADRTGEVAARVIGRWAADPQVEASLLRRALDESTAIVGAVPPISEVLKAEYLEVMAESRNSHLLRNAIHSESYNDLVRGDAEYGYFLKPVEVLGRWFLGGEPERSRRVVRLVFANWLAHCDEPWATRPAFRTEYHLFDPDPSAPGAASARAPEVLEGWIKSSLLARHFSLFAFPMFQMQLARGPAARAELLVTLAQQLYFREHGTFVAPALLVGRYLKSLPADYDPGLSRPGPRAFRPAGYPGDPWIERMIPIVGGSSQQSAGRR